MTEVKAMAMMPEKAKAPEIYEFLKENKVQPISLAALSRSIS